MAEREQEKTFAGHGTARALCFHAGGVPAARPVLE